MLTLSLKASVSRQHRHTVHRCRWLSTRDELALRPECCSTNGRDFGAPVVRDQRSHADANYLRLGAADLVTKQERLAAVRPEYDYRPNQFITVTRDSVRVRDS